MLFCDEKFDSSVNKTLKMCSLMTLPFFEMNPESPGSFHRDEGGFVVKGAYYLQY